MKNRNEYQSLQLKLSVTRVSANEFWQGALLCFTLRSFNLLKNGV